MQIKQENSRIPQAFKSQQSLLFHILSNFGTDLAYSLARLKKLSLRLTKKEKNNGFSY